MTLSYPTVKLGRVARIISGVGFPHTFQGRNSGDYPFLKVADLATRRSGYSVIGAQNWVSRGDISSLGARLAPSGSVVFPKVGAALLKNPRRLLRQPSAMDNNLMAVVPQVGDPRFWIYALSIIDLGELAGSGPLPFVNEAQIRDLRISFPDEGEQRRIADFLDAETGKLDRIQLLSNKLSRLLGERQASLLSNCFASHTVQADGALPINLALRRVVSRWIDYRGATPEKTVSGIPLVTAKNIRDGKIDLAASREYIAEDAYSDWMRRGLLMHSDVLLTTEAPLGQVAMVDDAGVALAQRVIVLRVDQRFCSPEWLYWYLRSPQGQAELELRATGSTALGIKADRLRGVPIPVLKPAEAKKRLAQLQSQVSQVESLQSELSRQRALITERRQSLITAAVTGQFDVSTASGRNVTDGVTA
ncbi:restriction endonuclease subunit S [Streptomyces sp. MRC013]|uniref:restriction endonuclease subunit S n=1 Tax=Streptomyces sp. MRC013 TaxID=2898276 RepID=UPI002025CE74|nr:restriction endonuclease subunit S [Streptomyces sp. MRC013]URM89655.1 restriction endonuclease subunit S [Streptomyces sp. MRC013]